MVQHEMEHVFARLDALHHEGWTPMWTGSAAQLSHKTISQGVTLVRVQHQMDIPFSEMEMPIQPEMAFHESRPKYDPWVVDCGIERVFAPGDVEARLHLAMSSTAMRSASFLAVVFGSVGNFCAAGSELQKTYVSHMRITLRRDFPQPGQCAWALAPIQTDTGELLEELGVQKATGTIFAPSLDGQKTMVTMLRKMPRVPMWSMPMLAPLYGHYIQEFWWRSAAITQMDSFKEVIETFKRDASYVVVSIRKCSRGAALLPEQQGSAAIVQECSNWKPWPSSKLIFPKYLQDFLPCIGISDVPVYDSLDGRRLVAYQAALRMSDWQRIEADVMVSFRAQRTAYRRLHGGTHAPDLSLRDAKFQDAPECSAVQQLPMQIQVRNTFLDLRLGQAGLDMAANPRAADDLCVLPKSVQCKVW